jgi:hypothetical protein
MVLARVDNIVVAFVLHPFYNLQMSNYNNSYSTIPMAEARGLRAAKLSVMGKKHCDV